MERHEVELGEEADVERRPHPGIVISVRLDAEDARRLFALARRTGRTSVEVVTDLVCTHLRTEVPAVPPRERRRVSTGES